MTQLSSKNFSKSQIFTCFCTDSRDFKLTQLLLDLNALKFSRKLDFDKKVKAVSHQKFKQVNIQSLNEDEVLGAVLFLEQFNPSIEDLGICDFDRRICEAAASLTDRVSHILKLLYLL